ncbi:hypothetical protein [Brevibacillus reuszeri]|nr:hypothetical protein [Brevibacillus reuszeri]
MSVFSLITWAQFTHYVRQATRKMMIAAFGSLRAVFYHWGM